MLSSVGYVALALYLSAAPAVTVTQESRSAPLAHELTALMAARGLRSVAAQDPDAADRFVVALVFPKVQLLVMSARHRSPSLLKDALRKRQYDEVYVLLEQAGIPENKVVFQDAKADGLRAEPDDEPDLVYEQGTRQTVFGGSRVAPALSAKAYTAKFRSADDLYSRLLMILITELKASKGQGARIVK